MTAERRQAADRQRILIVDDEESIVVLYRLILSAAIPDVTCDTAPNGAAALESFKSHHHRVVLMDLHMPVMDGGTAFAEIMRVCDSRNWERPAVVFCTGYVPPDSVQKLVADGRRHCLLQKPIGESALLDIVKSRLGPRR